MASCCNLSMTDMPPHLLDYIISRMSTDKPPPVAPRRPPTIDHSRYIPHRLSCPATLPAVAVADPSTQRKLEERLKSGWHKIKRRYSPESSRDYTVYTGLAGIAFLAWKVGKDRDDGEAKNFQHIALAYLHAAKGELEARKARGKNDGVSFILGESGVWAQLAVVESRCGNPNRAEEARKQLLDMRLRVLNGNYPFELLYGATGYLYSLLYVRKALGSAAVPDQVLREIVDYIVQWGRGGPSGSLKYHWHGKMYLGAAHGLAGIMLTLMDATKFIDLPVDYIESIKATIDYVAQSVMPTGNYPSRPEKDEDDVLVQWCHGAPGFVLMYARAYEVLQDAKYLALAESAAEVVWERGLLKKGNGLCHGVSGNAYCFLSLYRRTKNDRYLCMARQFALAAEEPGMAQQQSTPDHPLSLFEGNAGLMCLYFDLLHSPMDSRFPAAEL